jgi:hypothetical protein
MILRKLLIVITCFASFSGLAQTDSSYKFVDTSHLRISLLTCGVGEEIWETFGHTALRVTDSIHGTDNVYNYGTFNGFEEDFELKFMKGKLLYYVSYYPYYQFLQEYQAANRKVQEQELILDGKKKENIYDFLVWNAEEEHKYYKYDFLYDNCATRIRDVFPKTFGNYFKFGKTLPAQSQLTFRQIVNVYLYRNHFERFGINLLLGSKVDKVMSDEEVMFLPDYLRTGIGNGTVKNGRVAKDPVVILEGSPSLPPGINWAFIFTFLLSSVLVVSMLTPSLNRFGNILANLIIFMTGIMGCMMLVMWFGTNHQACQANFNILWALPTNLIFAFLSKKNKDRYVVIGIIFILISLFLHLIRIQQLPLIELSPLLVVLLFIYGMIYRKNRMKMY